MTMQAERGLQALEDAPDFRPAEEATDFQALHEIIRAAHARLDRNTWDYLTGGSETETTLCRNRRALDSWAFRPRVLRNVSAIDTSASFFGQQTSLPVIL